MKDKKQDVRQNAKIEDKKLDQVQGGAKSAWIGVSQSAKLDTAAGSSTRSKSNRCC